MAIDILLADDLTYATAALRRIVEAAGFQVVGAAQTGGEAVQLYEETQPDVVLMDITMPQMDGLESMRRIRELDPTACVIMCTALGQERVIQQAVDDGACDFVTKPFTPERVIAVIKKALDIV